MRTHTRPRARPAGGPGARPGPPGRRVASGGACGRRPSRSCRRWWTRTASPGPLRSRGSWPCSASRGSAGSPAPARRPGGTGGRSCRRACRRGSCPSRTGSRAPSVVIVSCTPAGRVDELRGQVQPWLRATAAVVADLRARAGLVEHPVVVVAAPEHELLVVAAQPLADRVEPGEVERRAHDAGGRAVRDEVHVDGRELVGVELEQVVVDRPRALTGQVPVGVVGEVEDRRRGGRRRVVEAQVVAVVQREGDRHVDVAGVPRARRRGRAAFAGRAVAGQLQPDGVAARRDLGGVPHALVEADVAAVKAGDAVVRVERVRVAAEHEPRRLPGLAAHRADAVAVAADDRAEVRVALDVRGVGVAVDVGEAERDVGLAAAPVGDAQRLDDAAVVEDRDRHAAPVGERVLGDRGAGVCGRGSRQVAEARRRDAQAVGVVRPVAMLGRLLRHGRRGDHSGDEDDQERADGCAHVPHGEAGLRHDSSWGGWMSAIAIAIRSRPRSTRSGR